jgi:hypothetical protein
MAMRSAYIPSGVILCPQLHWDFLCCRFWEFGDLYYDLSDYHLLHYWFIEDRDDFWQISGWYSIEEKTFITI